MSTASFVKDFFFELSRDSANLSETLLLERDAWLRRLDLNRKEETLFELEMYLRAIASFFNLHNQYLENPDQAIAQDFSEALSILVAAMDRVVPLSQLLLDRGLAGSLEFQRYVENRSAPDYLRLQMLRRLLDQRRPEDSLFLLHHCFLDMKRMVEQLLKHRPCTYNLFFHLGQIVTREIAFNRYFNPLLILEFRSEYDRIRCLDVLDALAGIPNDMERKAAGKIFLALFRLLHYLRYVPEQGRSRILKRSLILFHLFRSEATTLAGYFKIVASSDQGMGLGLGKATSEMTRELTQMVDLRLPEKMRSMDLDRAESVSAVKAELTRFVKACIVSMLSVYRPEVDESRLFESEQRMREESLRLRDDLWLYRQLVEQALVAMQAERSAALVSGPLWMFSRYFMQMSSNFLRYADSGPFERFHSILADGLQNPDQMERRIFVEDSTRFRDCLNETYDNVCRRIELSDHALDVPALQERLQELVAGRQVG